MSTTIDKKTNGCYSITADRVYGGKKQGMTAQIMVGDGINMYCISLGKKDAIDLCCKIISSLNEVGK